MCGIAGIMHLDGRPVNGDTLDEMSRLLWHRGPDQGGTHVEGNLGLTHRRLSIIDPAGGRQPIYNENGAVAIIYNGEVYNYRELRSLLDKKGHVFKTRTDTEVVLHAYEEWGIDCLCKFNGMFAFAIYDQVSKTLFLARDRLGIKPLYYCHSGNTLVFASEIKAILPAVAERQPNMGAIHEFLTFQNILGSDTFFKGITKLQPGTWLRCRGDGLRTGVFWDIQSAPCEDVSFEEATGRYGRILTESVARHTIADVTVGSYLSAGIDSSSIAAIAAQQAANSIHTFTGYFADAEYYDERPGAKLTARHIGARYHEVQITPGDYVNNMGRVMYHLDEPALGTGALPHYIVSKLGSDYVKVILTGHGGDEFFGGYQVNKAALLRDRLKSNPLSVLPLLLGTRPDELSRVLYYLLFPLVYPEVKYGIFIMLPRRRRKSLLTDSFLDARKDSEPMDRLREVVGSSSQSWTEMLMRLYVKTYLPTLLVQEDKMSMAHSVESRTPLCDNELLDLSLRIPPAVKLHHNRLKAIPRAATRQALPAELFRMPKRGFPTPYARWLRREPLRTFYRDLLLDKRTAQRGIFKPEALRKLLMRCESSRTDTLYDYARANRAFSISAVELWFRTFIDQRKPSPVV